MPEFTGFNDCKAGQKVKMKGKPGDGGVFVAHSITLNDAAEEAVIESVIQRIAYEQSALCILDHEIALPGAVTIKDLLRNKISLHGLKAGDRVKLIGKHLESGKFVPEKIKMKDPQGFNVAELQGEIDRVDCEKRALEVLGFTVVVDERTMFYDD